MLQMKTYTKFIKKENIKKYCEVLKNIDSQCFGPNDEQYDFNGNKDGATHYWWITYETESQKPIAYAGLKIYKSKINAFLCRAGVLKKYRGLGLHKKLLNKRIEFCKKYGIKYIYTYTSIENIRSANNILKNKFKITEPWFLCSNQKDFYYFVREI